MLQPPDHRNPLLAVVGPTAVGKSALAADLAARLGGEVVNADSRQVYRGMEIGTAAPSTQERALAPHHLYGIVGPDHGYSLDRFLSSATEVIAEVHGRGRLPILVGGTGQYIWALLDGWRPPHVAPDETLRRSLHSLAQRDGPEALHRQLAAVDPEAAAGMDPRNVRRTVRALEVFQATGIPFSQAARRDPPPYRAIVIGLTTGTRPQLHDRIAARVEAMLAAGWLDEVRGLLDRGFSPDLPAMTSMGYLHLAQHLEGEITLDEAARRVRVDHQRLARRQYAWFKPGDPRISWILVGEGVAAEAEAVARGLVGGEGRTRC